MHVDARVGALRQHEFDVQFDVAEFPVADEVGGAAVEAVQDAVAGSGHGGEPRGPQQAVPDDAPRAEPVAPAGTLAMPAGEVVAVEERHPAFLNQIGRIAVGVAIVELLPLLGAEGHGCRETENRFPHTRRVYLCSPSHDVHRATMTFKRSRAADQQFCSRSASLSASFPWDTTTLVLPRRS